MAVISDEVSRPKSSSGTTAADCTMMLYPSWGRVRNHLAIAARLFPLAEVPSTPLCWAKRRSILRARPTYEDVARLGVPEAVDTEGVPLVAVGG